MDRLILIVCSLFFLLSNQALSSEHVPVTGLPFYNKEQANQGEGLYKKLCLNCHGERLNNGQFAPPIVGDIFYGVWGGRPVGELFDYIKQTMPLGSATSLSDKEYLQILSYMFRVEGIPASEKNWSQIVRSTYPFPPRV